MQDGLINLIYGKCADENRIRSGQRILETINEEEEDGESR